MALGWHIITTESGQTFHWHNGGTGGYRSSMAIDSERKLGVIILSNISTGHPRSKDIDELCFKLMSRYGK